MPYSYEDYDNKSKTYTGLRRAIGVDAMLAHHLGGKSDAAKQSFNLLDAGGGTGNYTIELLKRGPINTIHVSDYNQGMINEARKNYEALCAAQQTNGGGVYTNDGGAVVCEGGEAKGKYHVSFSCDSITEFDSAKFPDNTYDGVMNNQVVHHLRPDDDFKDLKDAFKEFFRVLKPGGTLTINWSPAAQQKKGMFWATLIPEASATWWPRAPTEEVMKAAAEAAGFAEIKIEPVLDEILYDPELYMNPRNVVEQTEMFIRTDSTFNLCKPEEINKMVATVQDMIDNNTLDEWWAKKEAERKAFGQTTTIYARKPV